MNLESSDIEPNTYGAFAPRVCIVTTSFPRWPHDDHGTFVLEQAKALHAQGAFVRVIGPHAPGAQGRELIGGIEVVRPRYAFPVQLEILRRYRAGLPAILNRVSIAWLLLPLFLLSQLLCLIRNTSDIDIIHANWTLSALAGVVAKTVRKIPVVVTVQGTDIYITRRVRWLRWVTRLILGGSDAVIALSPSLVSVCQDLGVSDDRIKVIPHGIDENFFAPSATPKEPVILFVGSIIHRKGLYPLLHAASHFLRQLPEYSLALVGEGPEESGLRTLAKDLGIQDSVKFLGAKSPEGVRDWMQKARVLVLPSLEEGLGVVLLEALACGTPCVASAVGGIPNVITPDVGVLVPPNDPEMLSGAIIRLVEDQETWIRLQSNTRPYILNHFTWSSIASQTLDMYQPLMSAGRR